MPRVEIDAVGLVRQRLRLHVQIHRSRIVAGEKLLELFAPTAHAWRQDVDTSHRRALPAGADGAAANEAQIGMVEVVAVEIVDAHRCRARANETINNEVVEYTHGPHVPMSHDIAADVAAAVGQAFGKTTL